MFLIQKLGLKTYASYYCGDDFSILTLYVHISVSCNLPMLTDVLYMCVLFTYIFIYLYMYLSIVISLRSDSDFNKQATYLLTYKS